MTVVKEFHQAFGQAAPSTPPLRPDPALLRLRMRLLTEEYQEVMDELKKLIYITDTDAMMAGYRRLLKELADLRYVLEGCAVSLGLPIDAAYAEVHRSNMSKLDAEGRPVYREDGKVLKGENYTEADMAPLVPDIPYIEYEGNT